MHLEADGNDSAASISRCMQRDGELAVEVRDSGYMDDYCSAAECRACESGKRSE